MMRIAITNTKKKFIINICFKRLFVQVVVVLFMPLTLGVYAQNATIEIHQTPILSEELTPREKRMEVVRAYADNVLEWGRHHTSPLFSDGFHVDMKQPAIWLNDEQKYAISNLASQQNLFRMLTGLTNLTGDITYKQAAEEAILYSFDHHVLESGLLPWGKHQFIDLYSGNPVNKGIQRYPSDHLPVIADLVLQAGESSYQNTGDDEKMQQSLDSVNITIMSYNIRYDTEDDGFNAWRYRKKHVAEIVGPEYNADIIGLQEPLRHQLNDLMMHLQGYSWLGLDRNSGTRVGPGEFSAIFFKKDRFEVLDEGTFWLSDTPDVPGSTTWGNTNPRTVTWAKFRELNSGTHFYVYNTHFDHQSWPAREKSAAAVLDSLSKLPANVPVIFTGDLNVRENTEVYRILEESPIINDARYASETGHEGPTASFNGFTALRNPESRIDYIFTSSNIRVLTHRILHDLYDVVAPYSHVLHNHFPFYELMLEVKPDETAKLINAIWNAHMHDWGMLDMDRDGQWNPESHDIWGFGFSNPAPFFEGKGLSNIETGSELIYAAAELFRLQDNRDAMVWAQRLHDLYVSARHPVTGLGAIQYSKPERQYEPPSIGSLIGYTDPRYGDRAENQFDDVYGETAREGWVLWGKGIKSLYARSPFVQMGLAEKLGAESMEGSVFLQAAATGLRSFTELAWVPESNHFRPMWADGTDLSGDVYQLSGSFGPSGSTWEPVSADIDFLMAYIRAYRLTGDVLFWQTAQQIAEHLGWGNIGSLPGQNVDLNAPGESHTEYYMQIFAFLEMFRIDESHGNNQIYLDQAEAVADHMIRQNYHNGWFLPAESNVHVRFDRLEPLALLRLEAELRGDPDHVPAYFGGQGIIEGWYDGYGYVSDEEVIWSYQRDRTDMEAVSLLFPENGVFVTNPPKFGWQPILYASEYQFQMTETNFFQMENIIVDTMIVNTELDFPDNLAPFESYRWRVRAVNDVASGPWSETPRFIAGPVETTSEKEFIEIPRNFSLDPAYPNPFNPTTTIRYGLPESIHVRLDVYNLIGQHVANLINKPMKAGYHEVYFDAGHLASGVYLYRLSAGNFVQTRQLQLIK